MRLFDFIKKKKAGILYSAGLTAFTCYALLDTFVIPRSYSSTEIIAEISTNSDGSITVDKSVFENAKGTAANAESKETVSDASSEKENSEIAAETRGEQRSFPKKPAADKVKDSSENTSDESNMNQSDENSSENASSEKPSGKPPCDKIPGEDGHGGSFGPGKSSKTKASSETADVTTTISTVSSDEIIGTYSDDVKTITLSEYRANETSIYVADVEMTGESTLSDGTLASGTDIIKTALADDTYGKNIKAATSDIAEANDAILAINGDFYGAQNDGYVIRNGVLYRATSGGNEDLAILADGSFEIFSEDDLTAEEVLAAGAVDVLSFGPGLVEDGEIAVTKDEEVGKAMASNPRTAIGVLSNGHYVFVVTDGRTEESIGLTLYQLAEFMQSLGCVTAYNLDGGGSSTMYFKGTVVNNPTTGGNEIKERSVSDIVYIS
ncbi:phosphodiester glycosidase family protein [Oribacterium sp. WCC10]|uniref:phosphodiester glycosidase family protein n=1 Tax=Oribacterium sp. WCC10 TaxID=1855343 RepID=UPI0008E467D3|nr:phosphodiester glycosidase family protein [Oribacterium sp. WCC10]SFG06880.1 Predicted protein [Oribacterium sp. WCC10]